MSVGNLKDSGNQGNNFPYQLKSLQGLQCICDSLNSGGSSMADILQAILDTLTNQTRTHNIAREISSGTIVRPFSFSIANVGSGSGTVEGKTLAPGEIINYDAGVLNNTFDTVTYDATGTTFLITWVS
jgi:hypothetical protein